MQSTGWLTDAKALFIVIKKEWIQSFSKIVQIERSYRIGQIVSC